MATITLRQRGNTCQYFCLLYLMQESSAGALTSKDFIDLITFLVNRSTNGSGFISTYLKKSKSNEAFITSLNSLTNGQRYYIDNKVHAIVVTKTATNTFDVWNPQLNTVEPLSNSSGTLTTNTGSNEQKYPADSQTPIDVWELDSSKVANDTATTNERNRQITIINNVVPYLNGTVAVTNLDTPIAGMKPEEIKAFGLAAISTFKLNFKLAKQKLSIA